jgi:flagellar hook protein FlgE
MAFGIALSGLRSATVDLDVTGNNVANSNTTGFKASRAQFADLYAISNLGTVRDAVGLGVKTNNIAQQFNQGNISVTGNNLDLAINGQGFFVLEDINGAQLYSRAGAFGVSKEGFVVNSSEQKLIGFQADNNAVTGTHGPIQLTRANIRPKATSEIDVGVNLNAGASAPSVAFDPDNSDSYNYSTSVPIYDSLGKEHLATLYFVKQGAQTWDTYLRVDNDDAQTLSSQTLEFDSSGQLTTPMPLTGSPFGSFIPSNGAAALAMDFDFTSTTQFGTDFSVNSLAQDGFSTGRLSSIDIDEKGILFARFTNGQSLPQGQVALANFNNPQGLQPLGNNAWAETPPSGVPLIGAPGSSDLGLVQSGALEESNVDLPEQLINMIIAQRNFQANAQMIQAQDEITQTIINIR